MDDRDEARAALAHDLKSPLSVIVGFAELLTRRDDPRTRAEASGRILEAADQLDEAIDDVLTLIAREPRSRLPVKADRTCILLVEDDPLVRGLLSATLDQEAYELVAAPDEESADAIAARDAALVILDWQMPGRPGEEVLAAIKRRRPQRPVVVLTTQTSPVQRVKALDLGADGFLTKPFSPLRLLAVVEELLGRDGVRPD